MWFPDLQEIRTESLNRNSKPPFMYDCYNVLPYYTGASGPIKDTLSRIANSLIEGFNHKEKLPRYIFFIIDKDLVEALVDQLQDSGVDEGLTSLFNWLACFGDRLITARKDNMLNQRMGAVTFDTKICWVKMIPRPFISYSPNHNEKYNRSTWMYYENFNLVLGRKGKTTWQWRKTP